MQNLKERETYGNQFVLNFVYILLGCFLITGMVCAAQIVGSSLFLLCCLLAYLFFTIWACGKNSAFLVLLFFLPWSPLLKMYNGGISFFTIALLLCCFNSLLRNKKHIHLYQIITVSVIIVASLVAKAIQHNSIENGYLFLTVMLFAFPCLLKRDLIEPSFYWITIFFACGIISAALIARQSAAIPNIAQFITIESYLTVTRLSGFYGDPNFYSAHICACLSGVQMLLCFEQNQRRQLVLAVLALVLIYCGLLSASKSFLIVIVFLFFLWIPILFEKRIKSNRIRLFIGLLTAGMIIISSSAFQTLLQTIDDRFAQASNISELTTGRSELWINYIREFLNNPLLLLFGEGYTGVNLNNKASHNTLIQLVYQFGLIGSPFLVSWVIITLRNLFKQLNACNVKLQHCLLICIGVVLPWMGIDILLFDEFFLLPVYAVIGITYSATIIKKHS